MTPMGSSFMTTSARAAAAVIFLAGYIAHAQAQTGGDFSGAAATAAPQYLAPAELENLVAPIALYPDQLLSQVLAASTYPLEIVEAKQWLDRNAYVQGAARIDAAKRQNWDPSVQAMVAFPDALAILARDVQWTTALGNAFLVQQADVMNTIQSLRARAQQNGRLANTPQQLVTTEAQDGQSAIAIQPANPQVMYVPSYNPQYVWGAPAYGSYPQLGYPPESSGFGFGDAINLLSMFTGIGSVLTGGWGWILSWFTHSLLFNGLFFNHLGFGGGYGGYSAGFGHGGFGAGFYGGRTAWVHDPGHRLGVPYPSQALANRFHGTYRAVGFSGSRGFGPAGESHSFGSGNTFAGGFAGNRGFGSNGGENAFSSGGGWHTGGGSVAGGAPGRNYAASTGWSQSYARPNGAGENFGRQNFATQNFANRNSANQNFASQNFGSRNFATQNRPAQNFAARSFAEPQRFSAPKMQASRMSAPHYSAPKAPKMSAPHFSSHSSGGHSGGGHSGGGSHGGSKHH